MGKEPRRQRAHVVDVLFLCGYQHGGDQLVATLMCGWVLETVETATLLCSHRKCATFFAVSFKINILRHLPE